MNGAESLVRTLLACGVDTCFANPGTSEMHFVAALDHVPGMNCVLGLFEGVVTGAADGYARMAEKPAATLLHCGPGLGNGFSNLHNARRARVPMVNIVGDQATYHRPLDAALTADTEALARACSVWTRTSDKAATVGSDAAVAVQAARTSPGGIASLILPSDVCWDEGGAVGAPLPVPAAPQVSPDMIQGAARALRSGEPTLLLLAGPALRAKPLEYAYGIAAKMGAKVLAVSHNTRIEGGRGRHPVDRVPYPVDQATGRLKEFKHMILVGSTRPVAFFAYPGKPGYMQDPNCVVHVLARPENDLADALARLADELGVKPLTATAPATKPEAQRGKPTPETTAQTIAALLPDNAIVCDESVSFGRAFFPMTRNAAPHDWLQITGGAIGNGLPMATGAAVARRDRRVVSLQADGSAMYTVQALWTQAREKLDVTTVILANRKYAILIGELASVGAKNPGPTAMGMMDLGNPDLDWVQIAGGMGIEAAKATTLEQFADLFAAANKRKGPFVIELVI